MFIRYPHLEKLGNVEVENIELGETHVFPKIDGTNASLWNVDGDLFGGSRNRILTFENDNAGFLNTLLRTEYGEPYRDFLYRYPNLRLYGEWLVPHTLTGYREDAWKRFYVFDVMNNETGVFLRYEDYQPLLRAANLDFIPCYKKVLNGDSAMYLKEARDIRYLLKDEQDFGEGVVIKNYDFINKFGRQTWAKLVLTEFKEKHVSAGDPPSVGTMCNEEILVDACITEALVEKEFNKIVTAEGGWQNKFIPRLLETCFYCMMTEELYSNLKSIKLGSVNFKALKQFAFQKVKNIKPELF